MKKFCMLTLVAAFATGALPAMAQGLRAAGGGTSSAGGVPPTERMSADDQGGGSPTLQSGDYIVAVVNAEPITNLQVQARVRRLSRQLEAQRRPLPDHAELTRQVLEQMINERAQLQLARESGIKVDEPSVDQAEQNVAAQNQLTVEQLRRELVKEGMEPKQFRQELHDQLVLTRLREREVESHVRVGDAEVDQYLAEEQEKAANPANQLINVAQLLVAVPEGASAQEVAKLQDKAQTALKRAQSGEDFAALVNELSDADHAHGGALGLRPAERYPALFLDATRSLAVGEVTGPVRSGAGFHILKLLERRVTGLPPATVTQSHARHILLIPSAQLSEAQARDKLLDFKKRIASGQTDFATLAREYSQDGSAAHGGDLGWANPGQFVPEFEQVMNRLAPGQISDPVISRFGVHLIQLLERRKAALSEREQREMVRNMLRQRKLGQAEADWAKDVRARAYVELRDPPQ